MAVPAWPYTAGQRRCGGSVPPEPPRSTDASDRLTTPRRLRLPAWPSGARALCRGRTPPRGFGHGRHPIPPRPDAPRRGGRPRRHAHPSPPDGRGAARARIARRAAGRRLADAHGRAATARLLPEPAPETAVWAFDGRLPGPVLRVRHGDEARVRLVNRTERPLSLHWHGVRNVTAMDGVGGLTQEPVAPGKSFDYRFTPPDAGTFLVRPLVLGGIERAGGARALRAPHRRGARRRRQVDRDIALARRRLAPQRGRRAGAVRGPAEAATSGRLGNSAHGQRPRARPRRSRRRRDRACGCGSRTPATRARCASASTDMKVYVAAIDGQPTDTFEPLRSILPFSPGTRYDLLLDMPGEAGGAGRIVALLGQGPQNTPLVTLAASGEPPERPALPPIAPAAARTRCCRPRSSSSTPCAGTRSSPAARRGRRTASSPSRAIRRGSGPSTGRAARPVRRPC